MAWRSKCGAEGRDRTADTGFFRPGAGRALGSQNVYLEFKGRGYCPGKSHGVQAGRINGWITGSDTGIVPEAKLGSGLWVCANRSSADRPQRRPLLR
jgi:hypothetical protein